jgi:exopolysaccharide biosynthesis polyprenyl glycosylphosphotransferase
MFGSKQRKAKILFGISDIFLTAVAFEAAYIVRARLRLDHNFFLQPEQRALILGFSAIAFVVAGYWLNIYGKVYSARIRTILIDAFRQAGYGGLTLVLLVYALKLDTSRVFLFSFVAGTGALLVVFRLAARNLIPMVRRGFGSLRYILIVGLGDRALRLAQNIESHHDYGLRISGFLACAEDRPAPSFLQLEHEYRVYPIEELPLLIRKQVIDEVHFAVESDRLPSLEDVLISCDEEGVCTRLAVDFFPHVNSQIALERIGEMPLLTYSAAPDDEVLLLVKRLIDIILATVGLVLLSPVLLATAILIKLTSRGPVIFKQVRCGLAGRRFTCYKFRSMVSDAERRMKDVAHLNPKNVVTKIPNDPRLTAIGKFLRKFSIDELPQLFNVLRGDMSLVGPRPAIPSEVAQYAGWQRRRLRMRPGLTCLWALNGRDKIDFETWMRLDMNYIDNWSLSLDARIILQTIPQVISGKGAS